MMNPGRVGRVDEPARGFLARPRPWLDRLERERILDVRPGHLARPEEYLRTVETRHITKFHEPQMFSSWGGWDWVFFKFMQASGAECRWRSPRRRDITKDDFFAAIDKACQLQSRLTFTLRWCHGLPAFQDTTNCLGINTRLQENSLPARPWQSIIFTAGMDTFGYFMEGCMWSGS